MTRTERGPGWELRLGRWQDVLADVERVDSVITDPPYSERTHDGHNEIVSEAGDWSGIEYEPIGADAVSEIVNQWTKAEGWMACMTSHDLVPAYESAFRAVGRYSFAPVSIIQKRPRRFGDGPGNWTIYMMVARHKTREAASWGSLRGSYDADIERLPGISGAKPVALMRAIVRDYSRPGDLVCDPYAGSGTTLLAAVMEGRRAIGAEMDEGRFDLAVKRLRAGIQQPLL